MVFAPLGIDSEALKRQRRTLVHGYLDWSQRELHRGVAVGAPSPSGSSDSLDPPT